MKFLILFFAFIASAQAITPLTTPPEVNEVVGHTACVGNSFSSDGSVVGVCRVIRSSACSGRGCQPVMYTTTFVSYWDALGDPVSAVLCKTIRHHAPQVDVVTYIEGFNATNCPNLALGTTTVIVLDQVPYYYVTTGPAGQILVNSNVNGYLYLP